MRIDPTAVYRLKQTVLVAAWDEAGVLLDVTTRCCVELNRTGIEIVGLLKTGLSLSHISGRLAAEYGRPETDLQKDLEGFIGRLHEKEMIEGMIDGGSQTNTENQG